MNKDRVEGKVKDIAGRAQRQVGEWTGDTEAQVKGTLKQAEGKAQNTLGKAKDAIKKSTEGTRPAHGGNPDETAEDELENERRHG